MLPLSYTMDNGSKETGSRLLRCGSSWSSRRCSCSQRRSTGYDKRGLEAVVRCPGRYRDPLRHVGVISTRKTSSAMQTQCWWCIDAFFVLGEGQGFSLRYNVIVHFQRRCSQTQDGQIRDWIQLGVYNSSHWDQKLVHSLLNQAIHLSQH